MSNAAPLRRGPLAGRTLRLPLRAMREATGKTQTEVAKAIGTNQPEVSRLEDRADNVMLSTLKRYAEALGARCEVVFVFDKTGHRIALGEPDETTEE